MSTDAPGGGGYSDQNFESTCQLFEDLLGDLLGIEAASGVFLDYRLQVTSDGGSNVAPAPKKLTMPSAEPYAVYPTLPIAPDGAEDSVYQTWLDQAYTAGKQSAAGTKSWLLSLADNYYLVDTQALISGAQRQGTLAHTLGVDIVDDYADVSAQMFAHWQGEAQEEFGQWFALASAAVSVLLLYADSAQLVAGAAGDAIHAIQRRLLDQVQEGVTTLEKAIDVWHEDFDVFPDAPGSGWTLDELGGAISGAIDHYASKLPAVGDFAVHRAVDYGVGKLPYAAAVIGTYDFLVALDTDTDPKKPKTGQEILTGVEDAMRRFTTDGDQAVAALDDHLGQIRNRLSDDPDLVLPRLPRDPGGHYDPSSTYSGG